jgi:hypothetical protein
MKMCVVLTVNGQVLDRHDFSASRGGDIEAEFHVACTKFRRNHPDVSLFGDGEGFRMPAMASHSSGHGPAYENRPSTNPRGCGDGLWGLRVLLGRGDGETNSVLVSAGT